MSTSVRIPIDLRSPGITADAGNSFWTVLGLTAHDFGHWEFLQDVDGSVFGVAHIPKNVDPTPVAIITLILIANATTGITRMSVSTGAIADDAELFNPGSLTGIAAVDITVPGTAYHTKSQSYTLAAAPSADDILIVRIFHEGANANDTLSTNTILVEAFLDINLP